MSLAQRIIVIWTTALILNQLTNHNLAGGTLILMTLPLDMPTLLSSCERTLLCFFPPTRALSLNPTSTVFNPWVASWTCSIYRRVQLLTLPTSLMTKRTRMTSSSKTIHFSIHEKQSFKIFLKVIPRMKMTPHYPPLYLNIPPYEMHMSTFCGCCLPWSHA
jgi:hypothetical protein